MGFQILNKDKEPIPILELDKEAAEFWGKKVHPKDYAGPMKAGEAKNLLEELREAIGGNWFDIIGYNIHSNSSMSYKRYDGTTTWDMIRESILLCSVNILTYTDDQIASARKFCKPYLDLIDHWEKSGYTPNPVKD